MNTYSSLLISCVLGFFFCFFSVQGYSVIQSSSTPLQLQLMDSSCDSLHQPYEALWNWKEKLKEKRPLQKASCFCASSTHCSVDITDLLPEKVADYEVYAKEVPGDGPNCWNAAFAVNHQLSDFYYINKNIFRSVLARYCKERQPNEILHPGDIIAIRGKDHSGFFPPKEIHGAIYLDDHLVFSKNGLSKKAIYSFQILEDVLREYGVVDAKCYRQHSGYVDTSCERYAAYYNCESKSVADFLHHYANEWRDVENIAHDYTSYLFKNEENIEKEAMLKKLDLVARNDSKLRSASVTRERYVVEREWQLLRELIRSVSHYIHYNTK